MSRIINSLFSASLKLSVLAGVLVCAPGCFRTTAIIPTHPSAETHTRWVNGFLWGAVGDVVDTSAMCGGRPVTKISTDRSPGNMLVQLVTLGLYTPSRISVTCAAPYGNGYSYWAPPVAVPPVAAVPGGYYPQ